MTSDHDLAAMMKEVRARIETMLGNQTEPAAEPAPQT
jgi:hypothetical protein